MLPDQWANRFCDVADLDASYEELEDFDDDVDCLMQQGRIRSLQSLWDEADTLLQRAAACVEQVECSRERAIKASKIEIYSRGNHLLATQEAHPRCPGYWVESDDKEGQKILDAALQLDALENAIAGEWEETKAIVAEWLLATRRRDCNKAIWQLGLAMAEHVLGNNDEARCRAELAGLEIVSRHRLLNQAFFGARMISAYNVLGEPEEAQGWETFFNRLPVSTETKRAALKRSRVLEPSPAMGFG